MSTPKLALVTGASRGIGRAIAESLLASGRNVIACARNAEALDAFAGAHPGRVFACARDLADPVLAARLGNDVLNEWGPVDELVCAAGIVHYAPVGEVREQDLNAQLQVNLIAPFLLAQSLGIAMRARGQGSIVFVSSTLGIAPAARTSAYGVTKAALNQLARAFANELAPQVRVNAVAPGVVATDMIKVARERSAEMPADDHKLERELSQLADLHLLRRLGTPADVAQAVCFVLDASWITGSILTIDGGLLAR